MNNTETLEEKFSRNTAWSEEFKRGYKNGYNAAKSHWKSEMKKALDAKDRERINLLRVYPYNLIPLINGEDDDSYLRTNADEDYQEPKKYYSPGIMEEVMNEVLTERENKVLQMRYQWGMTLEEAGKECGVTRERIRQVEAKAIRKLRFQQHKGTFSCVPEAELREAQGEVEHYKAQADYLQRELDRIRGSVPAQREEMEKKSTLLETPIENLDLCVRSYNCLKRAGIQTLGDLCGKTYAEMMKVRNLGKRSLAEIEDKMKENGLRFKPEDAKNE
jgi:RNA polymerase sigma factor (sigma-70 family)